MLNSRDYAPPSKDDIKHLIPNKLIEREKREMTIRDIVNEFRPRDQDLKDAKYSDERISKKEEEWTIQIPDRQRFYVWKHTEQNKLIDTIVKNFPIPSVIISKTKSRGLFNQEDGQQRFITLWRFAHNLFAYMPNEEMIIYYDNKPSYEPNTYTLLEDFPSVKDFIDSYTIPVMVAKQTTDEDVLPEIFERLNSGIDLTDGDKLWNRKNSNLVKSSLEIGKSPSICERLKDHMGIDVRNGHKSKESLRTLVGLTITLAKPFEDVDLWGNTLTKAFKIHSKYITMNITKKHTEEVIKKIDTILKVYDTAIPGNSKFNNNTKTVNSSFTRLLGVMVYDICKNPRTSDFIKYWSSVLNEIRKCEHHIDSIEHMIQGMYNDAGTKSSNTNIGKNIRKRFNNIKLMMDEKYDIKYT